MPKLQKVPGICRKDTIGSARTLEACGNIFEKVYTITKPHGIPEAPPAFLALHFPTKIKTIIFPVQQNRNQKKPKTDPAF